jgi:hypothetical protein
MSAEALCQIDGDSDRNYSNAPSSVARSPIKLAQYLTENDSSEYQQALNIYTWIVNNIKYDVKALKKVKSKNYSPKETLKRKKGICYQYSALFNTLCQNAGISSREIIGYSRGSSYHEDDRFYESDHSWNAVKIDSAWYLLDLTWGSGGLGQKRMRFRELLFRSFKKPYINDRYHFIQEPNFHYFLAAPEDLIKHHLPVDPNWQLLEFPVSLATFESNNWHTYSPRMDSVYQQRIDSVEYINKLNKYEYLSDLQFLQLTAQESNHFNSRNSKLLGLSSYSLAKSREQISGNLEETLDAYSEALQLYHSSINQLKRHQRSANAESAKIIKTTKSRISNELLSPTSRRISAGSRKMKECTNALNRMEKNVTSHSNQISKLTNTVLKGSRPFIAPNPSRRERPDLVEKNEAKIERILLIVSDYQDSVLTLIKSVEMNIANRRPVQLELLKQYQTIIPLVETNSYLILQNFGLKEI